MKKGWEIKKLGEVCIVERGSSPRPIKKYQTDSKDGVNWIKIGDTKGVDKYIYTTKEKITKEGAEKSRYVKEGDFILSNSMSFGNPYIMKTDGYIHDGWFVFRLPDFLDKDYFYYLLTSPNVQKQIQSLGAGAIVKNISGDLVKKVDITYPKSLPEQQRIVSILDEAFAAIDKAKANAEQNLKTAKELFESYLQGVFEKKGDDWEETLLKEVCELKSGTTISPKLERNEGDVLYIKVGDMNLPNNEIEINTSTRFVNSNEIKLRQIIPEGSIIFPKRGGAIATNKKRKIVSPTIVDLNTMAIIPSSRIDKDYFFHWFQLFDLMSISNGANIPQINNYSFDEVYIPFPKSLEVQQIIVRQLDSLRDETQKLEAVYQTKMDDLEELKKSILQKAFAGELNMSELGFDGLKDDRILEKDKTEILQSSNPKNHNPDKRIKG